MKKLLLMALLAIGMTANAETVVNNDDETGNTGGIGLGKGADDNDRWSMHFALGVNIPTGAPDGLKFAPFRSWEFNWTIAQYDYTPKQSKTTLSAGLGLNWRVYTVKGHDVGFFKVLDTVGFGYPDGTFDDFSSNIHTTSLSMPLLVKQRFGKDFAISLGAQVNWNYYARIHNKFKQDDDQISQYTKNIHQRPFTVDVLGIVHISKGFGVYCKYSPMSVLKKDKGPDFKSLAVGFYF